MKLSRSALIFAIGLFAILSQALLFREFLVSFEGNELGIGAFFGSWFLWIGIGAAVVYRSGFLATRLSRHIEGLALLYLPAYAAEYILIARARDIMGIDPYQLFNFGAMMQAALLVNAPVSVLTGILFPLACRWLKKLVDLPVARVYLIESAGSFSGGLGATVLLAKGVAGPAIFLGGGAILAISVLAVKITEKKRWWPSALLAAVVILFLSSDGPRQWQSLSAGYKWQKLLPNAEFGGSFQTAQAEYLYGSYQGQFLVCCHGQVTETLPNKAAAGEILAIHLSQQPGARRILLAGSDLSAICQQLLQLKQVEEITLSTPDPEYFSRLEKIMPENDFSRDPRVRIATEDIRRLLGEQKKHYDLVILNFPQVTTAILNRFRTVEFYQTVKEALADNGVVGVSVTGGENVLGTELAQLGASSLRTLEQVFTYIAIKPGEQTWFLAGDTNQLSEQPGLLREKFGTIEGAENIYPPMGIMSIYLPDRIAFARQMYEAVNLPAKLLINRDQRPLGHLYGLLLLGKHSQSVFTRLVRQISLCSIGFFLFPILVLVVMRGVYVYRGRYHRWGNPGTPATFSSKFLIFSTGLVSISSEIILMYLLQNRYGTLYLQVGLIASLFMLGLVLGTALARRLVRIQLAWQSLVIAAVLIQVILLLAAAKLNEDWDYPWFITAFVLCGVFTGGYFPLAAQALESAGTDVQQAGGTLELLDHFGAAVGGFLTGVLLIAVLGTTGTLAVLAVMTAANILLVLLDGWGKSISYERTGLTISESTAAIIRKMGYISFGIGICVIVSSHLVVRAADVLQESLSRSQAAGLAPGKVLQVKDAALEKEGKFRYFEIIGEDQKTEGYIFSSHQLAGNIRGYAGPIDLAIKVDRAGKLLDFQITAANETPSYLDLLKEWEKSLRGKNLFGSFHRQEVPAVSGATISSAAIAAILEQAGRRFAGEVLGRKIQTESGPPVIAAAGKIDYAGIYLLATLPAAIIVARWGRRWGRRIFLAAVLVLGGWWFNVQYSSEQIATLLSGYWPGAGMGSNFLLWAVVPLGVFLCGNLYCGYLCPFGALQEILDFIKPAKWRIQPDRKTMRWLRFGKYMLLLIFIVLFFLSWDRTVLKMDILISFFSKNWSEYKWFILTAVLVGSMVFTRFWCRYLCPSGAFLSLLGAWAPLKRLLPAKRYYRCDLGVDGKGDLDCIYCDRCRYDNIIPPSPAAVRTLRPAAVQGTSVVLVMTAAVIMLTLGVLSTEIFVQRTWPAQTAAFTTGPAGGAAREVDMKRLQQLIKNDQLSNHEAEFYRPLQPNETGQSSPPPPTVPAK